MRSSSAAPTGARSAAGSSPTPRDDAARIIGKKSGEIAAILGYRGRAELIHRDDMVLKKA